MLTHPDLAELRVHADGEAGAATAHRTAEHLLGCGECRARMQWLVDVRASARTEAPPPPADGWDRIVARISAGETVLLPAESTPSAEKDVTHALDADSGEGRWRLPVLRGWRAAAAALLLAGGAAAAAPDGWWRVALSSILDSGAHTAPPAAVRTELDQEMAAPAATVALLVEPANGAVRVSLQQPHAGVRVHVRLVDGPDLKVEALAGAAAATFRTSPGRLDMVGGDSGAVILTLPLGLRRVQVDVEGRTLLLKERGEIRIVAPVADTVGSEFVIPVRAAAAAGNR